MRHIFIILGLTLLLPMNALAGKKQELSMVALEFKGVIEENKTGTFDTVLQKLAQLSDIEHNYKVMSIARGTRHFLRRKVNCIIPHLVYPPSFEDFNVITSNSFTKIRYVIFTKPTSAYITNKGDLKGKMIGIIDKAINWQYKQRFNIPNVEYVKVSNLTSLVHMLYNNRLDAVIHSLDNFTDMAKQLGYSNPSYDLNYSIAVDDIMITCHKSKLSQAYLNIINPFIPTQLNVNTEIVSKTLTN